MWYHMYVVLLSAWFAICCTQEARRGASCNRNYNGMKQPSGVIKSYNYPFDYRNNLECTYTIFLNERPPTSKRTICFEFHRFEVEKSNECARDRLQFPYNLLLGNNVNYCGNGTGTADNVNYCRLNAFDGFCTVHTISSIFSTQLCWPHVGSRFVFSFQSDNVFFNRGFYGTYWVSDDSATGVPEMNHKSTCSVTPDMCNSRCPQGYVTSSQGCLMTDCQCKPVDTAPCGEAMYTCFNRKCIASTLRCNGKDDCGDGSDENFLHARCPGVPHTIEACDFEHDSCDMTLIGWERVVATYHGLSDHTIGSTIGIAGHFIRCVINAGPLHTVYSMMLPWTAAVMPIGTYANITASSSLGARSGGCLSFWYCMCGRVGTLQLQARTSAGDSGALWKRHGNQGPSWSRAEVFFSTWDLPDVLQIMFVAKQDRGGTISNEATIAIDDISFLPGSCDGDDVSCTFELNFCGWNISAKSMDVMWQRANTPLALKGITDGYYAMARMVNASPGSTVQLISRTISAYAAKCLTFWYHIVDHGQLTVKVVHYDGRETTAWQRHGNGSTSWLSGMVPMLRVAGPFQIIIEAAGTNGMYDSVAVDNIVLIDDYCPRSKDAVEGIFTTSAVPVPSALMCDNSYLFRCAKGDQCIRRVSLCDGGIDCDDGSDEGSHCLMGHNVDKKILGGIIAGVFVVLVFLAIVILYSCAKKRRTRILCFDFRRWRRGRGHETSRQAAFHLQDSDSPVGAFGVYTSSPHPPPYSIALLDTDHAAAVELTTFNVSEATLTISLASGPSDPPPSYYVAVVATPSPPAAVGGLRGQNQAASDADLPPSYADGLLLSRGTTSQPASGTAELGSMALTLHKMANTSL